MGRRAALGRKTSASVAAAWDKNRRHARARTPPNPGARFHSKRLTAVQASATPTSPPLSVFRTADEPPDKKKFTLASPPLYRAPPPGAPQDSIDIIMMAPGPLDALPALLDIA